MLRKRFGISTLECRELPAGPCMKDDKKEIIVHHIILFLFVCAAYWQVSLFYGSLKWDTANQYYPWRYFLSECLQHGALPLWNPYQLGGYPFYADPQSGAWYPVSWMLGYIFGYSMYTVEAELVLTIFTGACGMYALIRSFRYHNKTALIAAMAFGCCGFFIGNAQHLTWVISGAWMCWAIYALHQLFTKQQYGYAILCALFLFLVFSGGYPAFLITGGYLFLLLFTVQFFYSSKKEKIFLLKSGFLTAICFLLLSSVLIHATLEMQPYINRGDGVSELKANANPFSSKALLSLLTPFATVADMDFFGTDLSMSNGYVGLFILFFLLIGITGKMSRKEKLLLGISLLMLGISLGSELPLRTWLYRYVPLMNLFRFPALFRLFFIIGFIVLASGAINRFIIQKQWDSRGRYPRILAALLLILAALALYSYRNASHTYTDLIHDGLVYDRIFAQAILQLLLISTALFLLCYRKGIYFKENILIGLIAIDLFAATQLNMYGSVIADVKAKDVEARISQKPEGFPIPEMKAVSAFNDFVYQPYTWPLEWNLGIFYKHPGVDGYSPFVLKSYDEFTESTLRDTVWQNPVIYFSDQISAQQDTLLKDRTMIRYADKEWALLKNEVLQSSADDQLTLTGFDPGDVRASYTSATQQMIVLLQNNFTGWKAYIDGEEAPVFTGNYTYITVAAPAGTHEVQFIFKPGYIFLFAGVTACSFLLLPVLLLTCRKRLFS